MHKIIASSILENPKLLNHLMEHSYWLKELNRNPHSLKTFTKQMKVVYKERPSDKINSAIEGAQMISTLLDTLK